jgi:hypothetical protein
MGETAELNRCERTSKGGTGLVCRLLKVPFVKFLSDRSKALEEVEMKIAGRPRRQKGHLSQRCGSWIGSWRRYDKDGRPTKESSTLGLVLEVSENEARDRLRRIITQIEDGAAITGEYRGGESSSWTHLR